jgi:hypothetical protein
MINVDVHSLPELFDISVGRFWIEFSTNVDNPVLLIEVWGGKRIPVQAFLSTVLPCTQEVSSFVDASRFVLQLLDTLEFEIWAVSKIRKLP